MSEIHTTRRRHLEERLQRLDTMVQKLEEQYDLETRVEERMRLEPIIAEKKRSRDAVETEIRALGKASSPSPNPPAPVVAPRAREEPPRLFYSYAHADENLRDELAKHLKILERQNVLTTWHDRGIELGTEWDDAIKGQLRQADIILLLVSPDFLASDYIWEQEITIAMERHAQGEARVIPIILRPCDWHGTDFGRLQGLPKDAKPISTWADRDEAFTSVARALRRVASIL